MSELQVLPLPRVDPRYRDGGKYPERIRVAMSDGTTHWYRIEIQQPAPVLRPRLEEFDQVIGYEKPADAATSNRPVRNETTNSIPPRRRRSNGGGLKNERP